MSSISELDLQQFKDQVIEAGDIYEVPIYCDYIYIQMVSSTTDIKVQVNHRNEMDIVKGEIIEPPEGQYIENFKILNKSGSNITATFYACTGKIDIKALTLDGAVITKDTDTVGDGYKAITDTKTEIVAASNSEYLRILQNTGASGCWVGKDPDPTNFGGVYLKHDTGIANGDAEPMGDGGVLTIKTGDALYAKCATGNSTNISYIKG